MRRHRAEVEAEIARARARPGRAARPARGRVQVALERITEIERNALGDPRRDRRGRGHHPPRPEGDPRGGGLRGRGRDRPRRRGRRARHASTSPTSPSSTSRCPGSTASSAAREIAGERRAAVLILTAFSQRDLIEQARDAGALAYLVKPFQSSELLPAVEVALGRFQEMQALHDQADEPRGAARDPQDRRPGQGHAHGRARPDRGRRVRASSRRRRCASGATMRAIAERVIDGELTPDA